MSVKYTDMAKHKEPITGTIVGKFDTTDAMARWIDFQYSIYKPARILNVTCFHRIKYDHPYVAMLTLLLDKEQPENNNFKRDQYMVG